MGKTIKMSGVVSGRFCRSGSKGRIQDSGQRRVGSFSTGSIGEWAGGRFWQNRIPTSFLRLFFARIRSRLQPEVLLMSPVDTRRKRWGTRGRRGNVNQPHLRFLALILQVPFPCGQSIVVLTFLRQSFFCAQSCSLLKRLPLSGHDSQPPLDLLFFIV